MTCVATNIGIHTADAEAVAVRFTGAELHLTFTDWQEQPRAFTFDDVLAFRWQEFAEQGIRDDMTYEVTESPWLAEQATLQAVPADEYAHYKLCFNACGVLDILCRREVTTTTADE